MAGYDELPQIAMEIEMVGHDELPQIAMEIEMAAHDELPQLTRGLKKLFESHLETEVFAFLPMECVYRCRSVCKEWNALLSDKFITDIWAKANIEREPWLVLCNVNSARPSMAYYFYKEIWKPCFSLSFLPRESADDEYFWHGSAKGLVLVDAHNRNGGASSTYVCNPCTETSKKLPPMLSIKTVMAKGIVQSSMPNTYTVVALGESELHQGAGNGAERIVEVYDSFTKSWRIAGHLPRTLPIDHEMVFWDGAFYCLTFQPEGKGILGFNITAPAGTPVLFLASFPEALRVSWPHLITCGSQLLVVAGILVPVQDELEEQKEVICITIWEFHRVDGRYYWKEIARMPPSLCEDFQSILSSLLCFQCVGVGDWVCLRSVYRLAREVVGYNLRTKSWSCLSDFHIEGCYESFRSMAFEPRPYMRVD